MPDGSLLVGVYAKDKDSNYNSVFKTGKGIKAQITNPKPMISATGSAS